MTRLRLRLRTPNTPLYDGGVRSIAAEDHSGWFGILPGREDMIAALPPGLLVFRDDEGDAFVALAGGMLDLHAGECRVLAREALVVRELDQVAARVEAFVRTRATSAERRRTMLDDLAREVMRRLASEVRT